MSTGEKGVLRVIFDAVLKPFWDQLRHAAMGDETWRIPRRGGVWSTSVPGGMDDLNGTEAGGDEPPHPYRSGPSGPKR